MQPRDLRGRVDLRDVPLVTIDGEDARDFDDAVYCEPIGGRKKGWRLIVAIADVGHYVKSGDALDAEAQNRSTSVYFPRRVIPMLPEKLSNGLCSLNPQVDRLVHGRATASSARGVRIDAYQFYPAVMHSHARLTYDEVWEALSVPDSRCGAAPCRRAAAAARPLRAVRNAGRPRARRAVRSIFETTETRIVCDANGRIEKIVAAPAQRRAQADRRVHARAPMSVPPTSWCAVAIPGCIRVHEGPTPERLANVRGSS